MDNFGIVIQARMNSSRLPGKVLMDFCGKPMLLFQIDVLKRFNLDAKIVVATTKNPKDDAVEVFCRQYELPYLRGSEENVFQRFCRAAEQFKFDHIVRLTGDNPLPNYNIIKTCIDEHRKHLPDLTSTRSIHPDHFVERYVPKGSSVDVINSQTLLDIDKSKLDDFQHEHVIPVFFDNDCEIVLVKDFAFLEAAYSVDTAEDFKRVSSLAQSLIDRNCLLRELGLKTVEEKIV
jgi:spore coat polysaccharide biosynthesis protein SpsF